MNRHQNIIIIILALLCSCGQQESDNQKLSVQKARSEYNSRTEHSASTEKKNKKAPIDDNFKSDSLKFDKALIKKLYNKLNSSFEIQFELSHLNSILNGIKLSELKKGKEFEKEMLFEDCNCECFDRITISYSENRYLLHVYVEFFEEELDWCPESTYGYSFEILNQEISDLKLDYMAG